MPPESPTPPEASFEETLRACSGCRFDDLTAALLSAVHARELAAARAETWREAANLADPNYSTIEAHKQTENVAFNIGYQKARRELGREIEQRAAAAEKETDK